MKTPPRSHLASAILLWEEDRTLWARITTNASVHRFQERLDALHLLPLVQGLLEFRQDRAWGGSGFEILFRAGVTRDQVRAGLEQL
ncbi:MAG: hypothetical protein L0Z62_23085 [Gemmataceae bacterium]|nr:hypothetical protein [Gemmataceae bacterium]